MPVHFNAILNEKNKNIEKITNDLLNGILQKDLQNPDDVYVTKNKKKFTITKYIINVNTNEKIGKTVITAQTNQENTTYEIIDVDLTLLSEPIELFFEKKLTTSSDSNEYYNVHTIDDERHFQIETVNRCVIEKDIINSKQKVYLSAFPFQLEIYNNIDEFNKTHGFQKPIRVANMDFKVQGYAEDMVAYGGLFTSNVEEICSFIIGKVVSFVDVKALIGGIIVDFVIIKIKTALGILPIAASREVFDLTNLKINKIIVMLADVKADFIK